MQKTRVLSLLLAVAMLTGLCACSVTFKTVPEAAATETSQPVPETAGDTAAVENDGDAAKTARPSLTSGTPWLASNCAGVITPDTSASLKDDYYLAVNKDDILNLTIAPGYTKASVSADLGIQLEKDVLALFADDSPAVSHDAVLAKNFYDLFLDWDSRNALGVSPLKELTEPVENIATLEELNSYFLTTPMESQVFSLFSSTPMGDLDDSSSYILFIYPSVLLLEDSAEYRTLTELGKIKKEATDDLVVYMLSRLGYSDEEAREKLENCYAFEQLLAPSIFTADDQKKPDYTSKINNHVTYEELEQLQGKLPVTEILDSLGYVRKGTLLLMQPEWLKTFSEIYTENHLGLMKDYLIVHGVLTKISALDHACLDKLIEYNNKVSGSTGKKTDEEYAVEAVSSFLKWQVARLYCDRYVTETDKETILSLCNDIKKAYENLLLGQDFLSEETKQKAVEKLRAISVNALYPDDWTPYSYENLEIPSKESGGTYFDAYLRVSRETFNKNLEKFKHPVDKTEWPNPPTRVNASYTPSKNSITISAAFCRGGMYNSEMTYEEVCGHIGFVIGHEISHSFDGKGSRYDKDGNLNDWWKPEEREAFNQKIQAIADYADTIYCWDGTHINGSIITGEACADMGGIAAMLQMAKSREDFDYDQFFRSCAGVWLELKAYNTFLSGLQSVHPPAYYRVNATLQQFDEFNECYGIQEGDRMYLAPEDRIAIW